MPPTQLGAATSMMVNVIILGCGLLTVDLAAGIEFLGSIITGVATGCIWQRKPFKKYTPTFNPSEKFDTFYSYSTEGIWYCLLVLNFGYTHNYALSCA